MTIRFKLIMAAIAIVVVVNSVLALVAVEYLEHRWLNEIQNRVRLDLNSARASYDSHLSGVARFLEGVALDRNLGRGLEKPQSEESRALLQRAFQTGQMDMLVVTDAKGKVIYRAQNSCQHGDSMADNPLVADAIREKQPAMGSLSVPAVELAREGKELAERARITLVPTAASRTTDEKVRDDGMIVAAAVPLRAWKPTAVFAEVESRPGVTTVGQESGCQAIEVTVEGRQIAKTIGIGSLVVVLPPQPTVAQPTVAQSTVAQPAFQGQRTGGCHVNSTVDAQCRVVQGTHRPLADNRGSRVTTLAAERQDSTAGLGESAKANHNRADVRRSAGNLDGRAIHGRQ